MSDETRRGLERTLASEGRLPNREERAVLLREGGSCGLDLSIPHLHNMMTLDPRYHARVCMPRSVRFMGKHPHSYRSALGHLQFDATELHPFVDGVFRPLSFMETWQVRIEQFRSISGDRHDCLADYGLSTSTGVAYQKDTGKFKIIPLLQKSFSAELNFEPTHDFDYDSALGSELDRNDAIYNQPLTRQQVLDHEGWNNAFEHNRSALQEAIDTAFANVQRYRRDTAMGFYLATPEEDILRQLVVDGDPFERASGDHDLNHHMTIILVGPPE